MFVDVEKMLPDEILKMISLLTDELSKKEKRRGSCRIAIKNWEQNIQSYAESMRPIDI